jgi:hypothetical protein
MTPEERFIHDLIQAARGLPGSRETAAAVWEKFSEGVRAARAATTQPETIQPSIMREAREELK